MKPFFYFFLLILLVWSCNTTKTKRKIENYYIYDSSGTFKKYSNRNDTLDYIYFRTHKTIYKYYDTFLIATNYKYYELEHYYKYNEYKDTSYVKHKSFLDSIKYFDDKMLQNEEKLDSFWMPIKNCWRCSGIYDTTKIYLILPLINTDSVIVMQVHRLFHQTQ